MESPPLATAVADGLTMDAADLCISKEENAVTDEVDAVDLCISKEENAVADGLTVSAADLTISKEENAVTDGITVDADISKEANDAADGLTVGAADLCISKEENAVADDLMTDAADSSISKDVAHGLTTDAVDLCISKEENVKDVSSSMLLANGWHDYRFMKNGKPRPSVVRDFPANIVPMYRKQALSDASGTDTVLKEKAQIPGSEGKKENKKIKESLDASAKMKDGDKQMAKETKGKGQRVLANQNSAKPLTSSSKKTQAEVVQEESMKQVSASPDEGKLMKAKLLKTAVTEKMASKPPKLLEKKGSGVGTTTSDMISQEAEKEQVEGEGKKKGKEKVESEVEQEKGKSREEMEKVKDVKAQQVKRKSGVRDLPEIAKPNRALDAVDMVVGKRKDVEESPSPEGNFFKTAIKVDLGTKRLPDYAKANISGKKKRPLEEPASAERSKIPKLAKTPEKLTDGESKNPTQVTPKAVKPTRKPTSTPSDSAKKVRRSAGKSVKLSPSTVDPSNARKVVLESLRLYDAVRRKLVQDEERVGKQARGSRADLQAATLLKDHNPNRGDKSLGSLPGVDVGDIFLFRTELSFARVHGPIQAGIEYLTNKESQYSTPVAISIISNVGQDGEDNGEEFVYTGQGGRSADNKQIADQKLERGNLALDGSRNFNVPVRVIRGIKDINSPTGKIYVYDGLYKVEETSTAKGSGGFDEFKFRLQRMPDQPELGSETLKLASTIKNQSLSSRKDVVVHDISKGKESQAVCVENTVDDDQGPAAFEYSTKVIYPKDIHKFDPPARCNCKGACTPSSNCSCFVRNGDELPYLNGGFLVRQKDYIFECNSQCSCPSNCRNRATDKGLKFRLDVFKTADRGWGVRPLEMIAAGSFVCEYTGKLVTDEETIKSVSNTEHVLYAKRLPDPTPRWGDLPSILPNRSSSTVLPDVDTPDLIIDASHIGNVARFINHSCSPNLLVQKVLSEHHDARYPQFKLFAIDNIPPMRELTFDYGYPSNQELVPEEGSIECLCGSPDCRGKLYL